MRQALVDLSKRKGSYNQGRWVTNEEAEILLNLMKFFDFKLAYESGTANGYSTCWLALAGTAVHTYDPVSRTKVWDEPQFQDLKPHITYHEERFDSLDLSKRAHPSLFFLDGDHSTTGITNDVAAVAPHLTPGDVVVFHDLNIPTVWRKWARWRTALLEESSAYSFQEYDTRRKMGAVFCQ